jgi:histidine triad (HIT) family protein
MTTDASPTLFQRIITREIPANIVYEDDSTIAFLSIEPVNKGHTLVVPKHPYRNMLEMPDEALGNLFSAVGKVARAIKAATNADGINITSNNEAAAGQVIFHTHIHVFPRFDGDNALPEPKHVSYADGEAVSVATDIAKALGH